MNHTPGPWIVGPHQRIISQGWSIRIGDDSAIAYVLGDKNPELQANARLIAAAPTLLDLCERCLRALDEDEFPALREELRQAITTAQE